MGTKIIIGSADPNFEPIILNIKKNKYLVKEYYDKDDKDLPKHLYNYAFNIIKGHWPEAESIIMKDPYSAYHYALCVIRGRWPEAEKYIKKDPQYAYYYAHYIIKGRWPEAEPYMTEKSFWTLCYNNAYVS